MTMWETVSRFVLGQKRPQWDVTSSFQIVSDLASEKKKWLNYLAAQIGGGDEPTKRYENPLKVFKDAADKFPPDGSSYVAEKGGVVPYVTWYIDNTGIDRDWIKLLDDFYNPELRGRIWNDNVLERIVRSFCDELSYNRGNVREIMDYVFPRLGLNPGGNGPVDTKAKYVQLKDALEHGGLSEKNYELWDWFFSEYVPKHIETRMSASEMVKAFDKDIAPSFSYAGKQYPKLQSLRERLERVRSLNAQREREYEILQNGGKVRINDKNYAEGEYGASDPLLDKDGNPVERGGQRLLAINLIAQQLKNTETDIESLELAIEGTESLMPAYGDSPIYDPEFKQFGRGQDDSDINQFSEDDFNLLSDAAKEHVRRQERRDFTKKNPDAPRIVDLSEDVRGYPLLPGFDLMGTESEVYDENGNPVMRTEPQRMKPKYVKDPNNPNRPLLGPDKKPVQELDENGQPVMEPDPKHQPKSLPVTRSTGRVPAELVDRLVKRIRYERMRMGHDDVLGSHPIVWPPDDIRKGETNEQESQFQEQGRDGKWRWNGWTIRHIPKGQGADLMTEGMGRSICIAAPGAHEGYKKAVDEGTYLFYSLRDPSNRPRVTFNYSADPDTGKPLGVDQVIPGGDLARAESMQAMDSGNQTPLIPQTRMLREFFTHEKLQWRDTGDIYGGDREREHVRYDPKTNVPIDDNEASSPAEQCPVGLSPNDPVGSLDTMNQWWKENQWREDMEFLDQYRKDQTQKTYNPKKDNYTIRGLMACDMTPFSMERARAILPRIIGRLAESVRERIVARGDKFDPAEAVLFAERARGIWVYLMLVAYTEQQDQSYITDKILHEALRATPGRDGNENNPFAQFITNYIAALEASEGMAYWEPFFVEMQEEFGMDKTLQDIEREQAEQQKYSPEQRSRMRREQILQEYHKTRGNGGNGDTKSHTFNIDDGNDTVTLRVGDLVTITHRGAGQEWSGEVKRLDGYDFIVEGTYRWDNGREIVEEFRSSFYYEDFYNNYYRIEVEDTSTDEPGSEPVAHRGDRVIGTPIYSNEQIVGSYREEYDYQNVTLHAVTDVDNNIQLCHQVEVVISKDSMYRDHSQKYFYFGDLAYGVMQSEAEDQLGISGDLQPLVLVGKRADGGIVGWSHDVNAFVEDDGINSFDTFATSDEISEEVLALVNEYNKNPENVRTVRMNSVNVNGQEYNPGQVVTFEHDGQLVWGVIGENKWGAFYKSQDPVIKITSPTAFGFDIDIWFSQIQNVLLDDYRRRANHPELFEGIPCISDTVENDPVSYDMLRKLLESGGQARQIRSYLMENKLPAEEIIPNLPVQAIGSDGSGVWDLTVVNHDGERFWGFRNSDPNAQIYVTYISHFKPLEPIPVPDLGNSKESVEQAIESLNQLPKEDLLRIKWMPMTDVREEISRYRNEGAYSWVVGFDKYNQKLALDRSRQFDGRTTLTTNNSEFNAILILAVFPHTPEFNAIKPVTSVSYPNNYFRQSLWNVPKVPAEQIQIGDLVLGYQDGDGDEENQDAFSPWARVAAVRAPGGWITSVVVVARNPRGGMYPAGNQNFYMDQIVAGYRGGEGGQPYGIAEGAAQVQPQQEAAPAPIPAPEAAPEWEPVEDAGLDIDHDDF